MESLCAELMARSQSSFAKSAAVRICATMACPASSNATLFGAFSLGANLSTCSDVSVSRSFMTTPLTSFRIATVTGTPSICTVPHFGRGVRSAVSISNGTTAEQNLAGTAALNSRQATGRAWVPRKVHDRHAAMTITSRKWDRLTNGMRRRVGTAGKTGLSRGERRSAHRPIEGCGGICEQPSRPASGPGGIRHTCTVQMDENGRSVLEQWVSSYGLSAGSLRRQWRTLTFAFVPKKGF